MYHINKIFAIALIVFLTGCSIGGEKKIKIFQVEEPRKNLRSGSIKNSLCLPFSELINDDHTFISRDKILEKFKLTNFDNNKNVVFSCGSGVTASVLALAYSLINVKYMPTIYDGSWAEYGKN